MRMIGMPKNFIGARPGRVYSWGGSASIQTASGTVVTFPQAEERAFSGLSIYGHSTQDGTPSPDNPVPIVSAGDEGEINVSVSDGGTQSQTLTLSTPGGLPGIPVTSGGNYTDESGQQWVCDEVDFERGVYVQRVIELDFDGAETWSTWGVNNLTEGITGFYSYISSGFQKMDTNGMLSNLLQYASSAWGGGANGINVSIPNEKQYIICSVYNDCLDDISTDDAAIESWKNILNTNNLHVMLILQDPIETDLTAEEIAAYQALHTYSPTTTVGNDAEAWMEVGYLTEE